LSAPWLRVHSLRKKKIKHKHTPLSLPIRLKNKVSISVVTSEKNVRETALQTPRSVKEVEELLQTPEQKFLCSSW